MDTIEFLEERERNSSNYTAVAMKNYSGYSRKIQDLIRTAVKEAYEEGYLKATEDIEGQIL